MDPTAIAVAGVSLLALVCLAGRRPAAPRSWRELRPGLSPVQLPYRRRDYFFGAEERCFYEALLRAVDDDVHVFAKVRLIDLLWIPHRAHKPWHFNRLSRKHVDFILCSGAALTPVLAIELDDAADESLMQLSRDSYKEQALRAIGLPLLRLNTRAGYDLKDLADLVRSHMTPAPVDHRAPKSLHRVSLRATAAAG